jgi:hypothetical protein
MAEKQEIEVFISEDGEVKFHIKGIKGAKCADVAKDMAKELGNLTELNYTSEYYEKEQTTNKTQQKTK